MATNNFKQNKYKLLKIVQAIETTKEEVKESILHIELVISVFTVIQPKIQNTSNTELLSTSSTFAALRGIWSKQHNINHHLDRTLDIVLDKFNPSTLDQYVENDFTHKRGRGIFKYPEKTSL